MSRLLSTGAVEAVQGLLVQTADELLEVEDAEWSGEIAGIFDHLAAIAYRARDFRSQRQAGAITLAHWERVLPADHRALILSRLRLADTMREMGDLADARALGEAVVEACGRTLPADHPELLDARMSLASTLSWMGELASARVLFADVLEARERTLPADHPDLLGDRRNLAITLRQMGDLAGARQLLETALEAFGQDPPADRMDLPNTRESLATTMHKMGDLHGARTIFEAVVEACEQHLPAGDPNLLDARNNLAAAMFEMGDLIGARAIFEEVLEARERNLPADQHDYRIAQQNLAIAMKRTGDWAGARALEEAVLEARERRLPPEHPDLLDARQNLAITLRGTGELAQARELEEAVIEVLSRIVPREHPDLLAARVNLAATLKRMGDLSGACALEEMVLEGCERTLPAEHPLLLQARVGVACRKAALGDLAGARTHLPAIVRGMREHAKSAAMLSPREAREALEVDVRALDFVIFLSDRSDSAVAKALFELIEIRRTVATEALTISALSTTDEELRRLREAAVQARRSVNDLVVRASRAGASPEALRSDLNELFFRRDRSDRAFRAALAKRGVEHAEISLEALASSLPEHAALVGFLRYGLGDHPLDTGLIPLRDDHLLADVLRGDGKLIRLELGSASELESLLTTWRAALGEPIKAETRGVAVEPSDTKESVERRAGTLLREKLLDPLLAAAGEDVTTLLVCPDDLV